MKTESKVELHKEPQLIKAKPEIHRKPQDISENAVYQHYKGGLYFVKDIIKHTETGELMVSYIQLETGEKFGRPLSMFMEDLMLPGYKFSTPRFKRVDNKDVKSRDDI